MSTRLVRGVAAQDVLQHRANTMTEAELQQAITDMADLLRVKWHHEVDSRKSKRGLPDLVLCGNRVEFWELKKQAGKTTPEQVAWLEALLRAGVTSRVVRPMHLINGSVQTWMKGLRP